MSNVPKLRFKEFSGEWEEKKLGEIADISSGGTPLRNKPSYWNGTIPWVTTSLIDFRDICSAEEYITEEGLNNSSAKLFEKNTILMAMYGQGKTRGKVGILKISATTNQACASINPKGIDYIFLYQYLMNQYDNIRNLSNEGGQKNLSGSIIKNILIPYPSKQEQEKIASFLVSVDTKIEQLTKKEALLSSYKKGVMQKIFSGEIRFKADDGSEFCEWEEKKLGDILKEYSDRDNSSLNEVVSVGKYGIRKRDEIYSKELSKDISKNKVIYQNTLSIGMGSTQIDIGILLEDKTYAVSPAYSTFRIINIDAFYLKQLLLLLNKELSSQYMITGARQGKSVNKNELLNHIIMLPSFAEQTKIANFLSSIDSKIEQVQKQLASTKEFKKALLQQMFV